MRTARARAIVAIGVIAIPSAAFADETAGSTVADDSRVTLGVTGGANWSRRDDSASLEQEYVRHFVGGAVISYRAHRHLALESGASYVGKGFRYTPFRVAGPGGPGSDLVTLSPSMQLHYVELPLVAKAILPIASRASAHVLGGGSFGVLVSASGDSGDGADQPMTENLDRTDVSALLGGGVGMDVGGAALTLDLYYEHGLSSVDVHPAAGSDIGLPDPVESDSIVTFEPIRNRALFATVSVRLLTLD
jgi:hypothetical protein